MKIITFPYAGGNSHSFNFLNHKFLQPDYLEVLEYPGRGQRGNESLLERVDDIVSGFTPKIEQLIKNEAYCVYGHSMGALIGYQICRRIESLGLKLPTKLIVTGAKSPKFSRKEIVSNLPKQTFWEEVSKFGGIPKQIKEHPELVEYFTPILKADFRCIENYRYNKNSPKLKIPIDVFYGSDEGITQEEADAWQEETTAKVNVVKLKGNHFFIFDQKDFFAEYFKTLQLNATV